MNGARGILVIGLGNADCGDDGLGPLVANMLAKRQGAFRLLTRRGDMLGLIEDWEGSGALILIDAAAALSQPGRVHRIDLASGMLPRELALSSTHAFGLADALALAKSLDRLPPRVIVYAAEATQFAPGSAMSDEVAAAAAKIVEQIIEDVKSLSTETNAHA